jgi:valyl-tRNA synthetase
MQRYFPNNCLVTGYDIIPFWVNRMTFQSLELNKKVPFKDVLIHGLIRDKLGRKMSKSLGNGIDPMDMCDKYGADALRYYLCTDCAAGTDLRFDEEKVKSTWNFINKLWNASRFVLMNIEDLKEVKLENLSSEDKWIITKYEKVLDNVTKHMEKYDFNIVGSELYNFIWEDFCSNYIEFAKFNLDKLSTKSTLYFVLNGIIKMLHPFMPFVTEEIYSMLPIKNHDSIMISKYPLYDDKLIFTEEEKIVDEKIEFIKAFRNIKAENNISKDAKVIINTNDEIIIKMLKLQDNIITKSLDINSYQVSYGNLKATIYFEKEVTKEDIALKNKNIENLKASIERRKKLLANENYVAKAPQKLVEEEKNKLKEEEKALEELLKN